MTSLSSKLKILGAWKKGKNFLVFLRQYGGRQAWEFLVLIVRVELIALGEIVIKPWR